MFCRYVLRTTDLDAARTFYARALALQLPEGAAPSSALEAWPLHERARALGAPAHWLGLIASDDMDGAVERLVALAGERLGPLVRTSDGRAWQTLRDPWGAVVAVCAGVERPREPIVTWHQLHSQDAHSAWARYSELFGWAAKGTIDVPDPAGGFQLFSWDEAGAAVGSMGNTARWEGVHAHWMYCFEVADIRATAERMRTLGGTAMDVLALPNGVELCACEDPQGAAFGLASRYARS